jgi:hypothetical protein
MNGASLALVRIIVVFTAPYGRLKTKIVTVNDEQGLTPVH